MKIDELQQIFLQHEDAEQAQKMTDYLRGKFPHFGIQTPLRRQLSKEFLKEEVAKKRIDWIVVDELWSKSEREFHQVACDLLIKMKKHITAENEKTYHSCRFA